MARSLGKECPIAFHCDLHGHSRSKNIFMYGNTDDTCPLQYQIFPFVLSKICKNFSFTSSRYIYIYILYRFNVQKSKSSTARVTFWKEMNIPNTFTLEASFFGPDNQDNKPTHFNIEDYENVGHKVAETLLICHQLNFTSIDQNSPTELIEPESTEANSRCSPLSWETASVYYIYIYNIYIYI